MIERHETVHAKGDVDHFECLGKLGQKLAHFLMLDIPPILAVAL
jgi:hypothetical protein